MENQIPEANWKERILFFLGKRKVIFVEENAMLPPLKKGDAVLLDPTAEVEVGDIVLINHPSKQNVKMIKRIGEISKDEKFLLIGDDEGETSDSRSLSEIPKKDILGKITCRLK